MKSKIKFFKILLVFIFVVDLNAQGNSYNVSDLFPRYDSYTSAGPGKVVYPSPTASVDDSNVFLINTIITKEMLDQMDYKSSSNSFSVSIIGQVGLVDNDRGDTYILFYIKYQAGIYKLIIEKVDLGNDTYKKTNYEVSDILFNKGTNFSLNIFVSDYSIIMCTDSQDIVEDKSTIKWRQAPVFYGFDVSNSLPEYADTAAFITGFDNTRRPVVRNFSGQTLNIFYLKDNINSIKKTLQASSGKVTNYRVAAPKESEIPETVATDLGNSLKIYPNPSNNGVFSIDFTMKESGSANFEIIDIKGQKVFEQKDQNYPQGGNTKVIDTQNQLPAGTYIVRITGSDSTISTGRILIK